MTVFRTRRQRDRKTSRSAEAQPTAAPAASRARRTDQIRTRRQEQTPPPVRAPLPMARRRRSGGRSAPLGRAPQPSATRYAPPVLVRAPEDWRGSMASQPGKAPRKSAGGAPRRRFDVALNIPGAELRLPAIPVIQFGWRAVSAILVVLMLGALYSFWNVDRFRVEMVEVQGLQRLTSKDINLVLGAGGQSIFALDPQDLTLRLQRAFPELDGLQVRIGFPARVVVAATERQPLVVWVEDGVEKWVDADGVAFDPRGDPSASGASVLIRVQAKDTPPLPAELLADAPRLRHVMAVSQLLDPQFVNTIQLMAVQAPRNSTLVYDSTHGLGWQDGRGWPVYFGREVKDMAAKLLVYKALGKYLETQGLRPEYVSVESPHAPYYRLK